jgi:quinoprotein glucose dehydrogenase
VHHGLWDYDTPAAPNLIDITVDGKRIKAVRQVTKQAFLYVFDRVTGKPVWPIEEQPVPPSSVPASARRRRSRFRQSRRRSTSRACARTTSSTSRRSCARKQSRSSASMITARCSRRLRARHHPAAGRRRWRQLGGAAIDPETGMLYVGTYRLPFVVTVRKPSPVRIHLRLHRRVPISAGPRGVPLLKPPFGSMLAVDMNSGEHRFRFPSATAKSIPSLRALGVSGQLGFPTRSWALLTKNVMIVVQSGFYSTPRLNLALRRRIADLNNFDPKLWVYDKADEPCWPRSICRPCGGRAHHLYGRRKTIHRLCHARRTLTEELIAVALP